jgi:hypothetical protein
LQQRPDFWLWFYLTFAVSSTMMPSPSDRNAWTPLVLTAAFLLALSLVAGAGPWLIENLSIPLNQAFRSIALVLGITAGVHLVLLPPVWFVRLLLMKVTGLRVIG